jgi:hypothetical protein
MLKLQDGTRKSDKLFTYSNLHQTNQPTSWLNHFLEHPWCLDKPRATLDLQDSPRPGLKGTHHLPPYSILCTSLRHPHPNGFLSRDSQKGVPELCRFGLPGLCEVITFCSDLRLKSSLRKLVALLESFPTMCYIWLARSGVDRFLTFSGRESNC